MNSSDKLTENNSYVDGITSIVNAWGVIGFQEKVNIGHEIEVVPETSWDLPQCSKNVSLSKGTGFRLHQKLIQKNLKRSLLSEI